MNTPSKADIIKIKLGRAKKTLREAEAMIDNSFPDAAINRLYYACFYAATALRFEKDIYTKTIKQSILSYNKLIVKELHKFDIQSSLI